METTLRNNTGNVASKEINTIQGYTMNRGIGAMYSSPGIFYMYIDRGPSAHLHSLISLKYITVINTVTSTLGDPLLCNDSYLTMTLISANILTYLWLLLPPLFQLVLSFYYPV